MRISSTPPRSCHLSTRASLQKSRATSIRSSETSTTLRLPIATSPSLELSTGMWATAGRAGFRRVWTARTKRAPAKTSSQPPHPRILQLYSRIATQLLLRPQDLGRSHRSEVARRSRQSAARHHAKKLEHLLPYDRLEHGPSAQLHPQPRTRHRLREQGAHRPLESSKSGLTGSEQADYTTFFSNEKIAIHMIQAIPSSPILPYWRDPAWVQLDWTDSGPKGDSANQISKLASPLDSGPPSLLCAKGPRKLTMRLQATLLCSGLSTQCCNPA